MPKLPMNFDWKAAKATAPVSILNPYQRIQQPQYKSSELCESLISHAELQVCKSSDVNRFKLCGNNAYKFVVDTFINEMINPYINTHKLDGDDIIHIAHAIQRACDDGTIEKPINESGIQVDAKISEDGQYVIIHPSIIVKAIIDKCM